MGYNHLSDADSQLRKAEALGSKALDIFEDETIPASDKSEMLLQLTSTATMLASLAQANYTAVAQDEIRENVRILAELKKRELGVY